MISNYQEEGFGLQTIETTECEKALDYAESSSRACLPSDAGHLSLIFMKPIRDGTGDVRYFA